MLCRTTARIAGPEIPSVIYSKQKNNMITKEYIHWRRNRNKKPFMPFYRETKIIAKDPNLVMLQFRVMPMGPINIYDC